MNWKSLALLAASAVYALEQDVLSVEAVKPKINQELLDLHRDLIQINSVSGDEGLVSDYLEKYLEGKNLTVEVERVDNASSRRNIYAYPGSVRDTKVLLTSHIDTVPPYFNYSIEDNLIYGRGSVDAKSCVAAQITALLQLLEAGDVGEGDVALLFVVDEEVGGAGMMYASENLGVDSWESVIFGEPTELKLGVGHKGIAQAVLKAHGKAVHSGYPYLGLSANEVLIGALAQVIAAEWPESDLLGLTTANIGTIQGGVAANVVPAEASAEIAVRVSADPERVVQILEQVAASDEHLELEVLFARGPTFLDYDVPGFDNIILAYSTDVPNLAGDFAKYLYGPGSILVAHSADEFVSIEDLHSSVKGYKKLVHFALDA